LHTTVAVSTRDDVYFPYNDARWHLRRLEEITVLPLLFDSVDQPPLTKKPSLEALPKPERERNPKGIEEA
jgi:hypothetical protein